MYDYRCKIIKIIDGDTVDVDIDLGFNVVLEKQRVRLMGIDTPESRTRDLEEKKYGLMAKDFVKKYMPVGSLQQLATNVDKSGEDERGKFGRILGTFFVEDEENYTVSLNEMMISHHHAVKYTGQNKEEVKEEHMMNRKLLDEKT
jgi:micrococcal nuclease